MTPPHLFPPDIPLLFPLPVSRRGAGRDLEPPRASALATPQQRLKVWHCECRRAVQKYLPQPPWPVLTFPFITVLLLCPFLPCQIPAFPVDFIYLLFETNTQVTQFDALIRLPTLNRGDEIKQTDQGCLFPKYAPNPHQTAEEDRPA